MSEPEERQEVREMGAQAVESQTHRKVRRLRRDLDRLRGLAELTKLHDELLRRANRGVAAKKPSSD